MSENLAPQNESPGKNLLKTEVQASNASRNIWSRFLHPRQWWEDFAMTNNYTYLKEGAVNSTSGAIFHLPGRDQKISNIITGTFGGHKLQLFYSQTFNGPNTVYKYVVLSLDMQGQLGTMLMAKKGFHPTVKGSQLDIIALVFQDTTNVKNLVSLGGDSDRSYCLFAPPEIENEALAVFSSDTIALIESQSKDCIVETAGNFLYIYLKGQVAKPVVLLPMFALANQL